MIDMENPPLISAIITTHNRLGLLKRAIAGVRSQTYKNIELIVVDDASDDGTEEFCRGESLRYIRIEKKDSKGGNHARNLGINAASGQYLAFCDDDDCWLPEKIEKQLRLMHESGAGLVHCARRVEIVKPDGSCSYSDQSLSEERRGDLSRRVLYLIPAITSSILVKRELVIKAGLFDESIRCWQEYELCIRLAQITKFDFVSEPLYLYRVNFRDKHRITNKYKVWKSTVSQIRRKHKALYRQLSVSERMKLQEMISADAIERANAAGLKFRFLYHRIRRGILHIFNK